MDIRKIDEELTKVLYASLGAIECNDLITAQKYIMEEHELVKQKKEVLDGLSSKNKRQGS